MFIRRIHLIGILVVVFFVGAVSGTVYDSLASRSVEKKKRVKISDLAQEVNLSNGQKMALDAILENSRKRTVELSRDFRSDFKMVWQETREEIRGLMTPEQLVEFDKLLADYDKKRKEREAQRKDNKH